MFETIRMLLLCGAALFALFLILLSLPQSKLRDVLMPVVGLCFAVFCGVYVLSPIDILPEAVLGPFGLIDDVGAVVAGIASAKAAITAKAAAR